MSPVTITQAPLPLNVGQDQHSAFPGLAVRPDGRLHLVWRQGKDHYVSRDGKIMSAVSWDGGATYEDVRVLRSGGDYRDPSIAYLDDNDTSDSVGYLTWFTGSTSSNALGAAAMREWGPTVAVDALAYAAICAPLVKLPDGRLGAAFYGRKPTEPIDTAWMAWSDNNGATWSTNRIINMISSGAHANEPWLVVDGSMIHFLYRWGMNDGIGIRSSPASGASGWDTPRKILTNATGRPTVQRALDGTLVVVYREKGTGAARIASSVDQAKTWVDGGVLLASKGGVGMTYAAMVNVDGEAGAEIVGVVGAEEPGPNGPAVSKLYGYRLSTTAQPARTG